MSLRGAAVLPRALVRLGHRHPWAVLAGAALVIAGGVLLGTRLRFETDVLNLMPRHDPVVRQFKQILEDFGSLETLLIAVSVKGEDDLERSLGARGRPRPGAEAEPPPCAGGGTARGPGEAGRDGAAPRRPLPGRGGALGAGGAPHPRGAGGARGRHPRRPRHAPGDSGQGVRRPRPPRFPAAAAVARQPDSCRPQGGLHERLLPVCGPQPGADPGQAKGPGTEHRLRRGADEGPARPHRQGPRAVRPGRGDPAWGGSRGRDRRRAPHRPRRRHADQEGHRVELDHLGGRGTPAVLPGVPAFCHRALRLPPARHGPGADVHLHGRDPGRAELGHLWVLGAAGRPGHRLHNRHLRPLPGGAPGGSADRPGTGRDGGPHRARGRSGSHHHRGHLLRLPRHPLRGTAGVRPADRHRHRVHDALRVPDPARAGDAFRSLPGTGAAVRLAAPRAAAGVGKAALHQGAGGRRGRDRACGGGAVLAALRRRRAQPAVALEPGRGRAGDGGQGVRALVQRDDDPFGDAPMCTRPSTACSS